MGVQLAEWRMTLAPSAKEHAGPAILIVLNLPPRQVIPNKLRPGGAEIAKWRAENEQLNRQLRNRGLPLIATCVLKTLSDTLTPLVEGQDRHEAMAISLDFSINSEPRRRAWRWSADPAKHMFETARQPVFLQLPHR